jgi:hypothetical protein
MNEGQLESSNFDRYLNLSERAAHDIAIAANDAFTAAMNREIRKGKIKVSAGTHVDHSPNYGARRIYGDVPWSSCGSPAAMCSDNGGAPNGAQSLK